MSEKFLPGQFVKLNPELNSLTTFQNLYGKDVDLNTEFRVLVTVKDGADYHKNEGVSGIIVNKKSQGVSAGEKFAYPYVWDFNRFVRV
jgi:hypothetical protein